VGFAPSRPEYFNRYAYVGNDPVNKTDPTGEFGVLGFAIGAGLEIISQAVTGELSFTTESMSKVAIAGAVGFVTGGVGGKLATQALQGTITAARAVGTTAAAGGAASGVGKVASNAVEGKATTATQAGLAVVGGAAGAGAAAGSTLANRTAASLEKLAQSSNLGQGIASATRQSYGAGAEASTSFGEVAGGAAVDAVSNAAQNLINDALEKRP
jgi:hypothetical protein